MYDKRLQLEIIFEICQTRFLALLEAVHAIKLDMEDSGSQ